MTEQAKPSELLALTTNIVAAHVANNSVAVADLPRLMYTKP
jgi:predicted transcriptional regulator